MKNKVEVKKAANQNSRDRRVTRTRENLKGALISLLEKRSYSDITINDISNYADCNRVTFYAHYRDKDDLLEDLIDEKINGLVSAMKSLQTEGKTSIDLTNEVHPGGYGLFNFIYENSQFFKIFYTENKIPGFWNKFYNRVFEYFNREIDLIVAPGEKVDINKELYNYYLASAILGVVGFWVKDQFKYSPTYMAKQLRELINTEPIMVIIK